MSDVLVKSSGMMREIAPLNGKHYTLQEITHYIGGYMEIVHVGNGKVLIMDEEGKIKGKLPNRTATGWLLTEGINDWIAGDVILIDRKHIK